MGMLPLVGEVDALGAAEPPDPGRGDDVQVGRQRPGPHLEADLVVALAGAPVGDRVGPVPPGRRNQVAHDDRPRQRRDERVLPLVRAFARIAGTQKSSAISARASITSASTAPAASARVTDGLPVLAVLLACPRRRPRRSPRPRVLLQPPDGHRGVETAAVCQYYPLRHVRPSFLVRRVVAVAISSTGSGAPGPPRARRATARSAASCSASMTLGHHHQHGVVTGHRPDHPSEPTPVERRAYDMGRARRGAEHHQVPRRARPPPPTPRARAAGGRLGRSAGSAARAGRRPSRRRAGGP